MANAVKMPQMGLADGSCLLANWEKKKGEFVKVGDELFIIETDKTTFTVVSEFEGQILEIFFNAGDEVEVMTTVCVIGQEGEDISDFCPTKTEGQPLPEEPKQLSETKSVDEQNADKTSFVQFKQQSAELKISPRAEAAAIKYNVDCRMAEPTGPDGRIIERDIIKLAEEGSKFTKAAKHANYELANVMNIEGTGIGGRITISDLKTDIRESQEGTAIAKVSDESGFKVEKFSNIRKIIAKNMKLSLSTIPQLTYNATFDATEILGFREKLKTNKEKMDLGDISINDLILFAVSRTLPKYKHLNAHVEEDSIKLFENVNLGVAVDTERGLMVPTVFNANKMTLSEMSRQTKVMIEGCRKGGIAPELLRGGTFTVSNLGSFGIESFTPIINPPQTGILGVSCITYKTKIMNGNYVTYPAMGLSLTCDHRAIDGAPSARFLKELINNLENITMLMTM